MSRFMVTRSLWIMSIFCIIAFLYIAIWSFWLLWKRMDQDRWEKWLLGTSPEMQAKYEKMADNKFVLLIIGTIALVLGLAIIVLLCMRKDLLTYTKPVLRLGINVVFKYPLLFLVMIFCFLFFLGNIAAIFYAIMGIYTTGSRIDNPLDGRPYPEYSLNIWKFLLMAFFLFGAYWVIGLWNNILDFTVAGTAINDYFKITHEPVTHPFCTGLTYHLGSIAYASLVLTPIDITRFLFGWIYEAIRVERPNGFQKCLSATCFFCCWPYERWCLMIDDNALAMVYMIKRSFCPSGRKDYYLNKRVGRTVEELRDIGLIHSMTARFAASLLTAFIVYLTFTRSTYHSTMVNNPLVPTIVRNNILKWEN